MRAIVAAMGRSYSRKSVRSRLRAHDRHAHGMPPYDECNVLQGILAS